MLSEQLSLGNLPIQPKSRTKTFAETPCLFSRKLLGWNGVELEYYQASPGNIKQRFAQHLILVFFSQGEVKQKLEGSTQVYAVAPGSIIAIPASILCQMSWLQPLNFAALILKPSAVKPFEALEGLKTGVSEAKLCPKGFTCIAPMPTDMDEIPCHQRHLSRAASARQLDGPSVRVGLKPQFEPSDGLMYNLVSTLLSETSLNQEDYRLYRETLTKTLAIHLFQKYFSDLVSATEDKIERSPRLDKAIAFINENLDRNLCLEEMAAVVNTSKYYFCKLFRRLMGISPYQYLLQQRIEKSKTLLHSDLELSIADISLRCGFANQSHLSKCFRKFAGVTPKAYRNEQWTMNNGQ